MKYCKVSYLVGGSAFRGIAFPEMPWHGEEEGRDAVAHSLADTCIFQGVCVTWSASVRSSSFLLITEFSKALLKIRTYEAQDDPIVQLL